LPPMSAINKDTQACASACASTSEPDEKEVEEYDENVAALQLLFESRNPPCTVCAELTGCH